jgi:glycerol-3-phosphate acyltransferase PlsY
LFALTVVPLLTAAVVFVLLTMRDQPRLAQYSALLPLSYLLGSLPWGYMLPRWRRGVDIREYGSGRTGMSNVLRTAGGRVAALVLGLDVGKGVLAVMLARVIIGETQAEVAAGLLVLIGHNWPVFLQFRGGRGIAPGAGVLAIIAPISAAISLIGFIFATLFSRYLSLGSITGVVAACLSLLALDLLGLSATPYTIYGFLGGAIIIWQHRDNIQRIRQGNETRLGHPARKLN